jgi:diaminopimelate decarboxylase
MRSLGFNADKILYYQKDKVMRTFKNYTMGTITTLFYVWYYSEMNRADNMLKDLSSKCPDFIRLVIDVQDNRGHSGKMHFKDEKLGFTKKNLDNAVNAFLEILFERGELQS